MSADLVREAFEVAQNLTDPQRKAVLALTSDPAIARRDSFSALAAFNLVWPGIATLKFDRREMRDTYCLTAFGQLVKGALTASVGEAGTAETPQSGSVHEHAVPKGDAQ